MKKTGQYAKVDLTVGGTAVTVMELREWSVSGSTEKVDSTVAGTDWTEHEIGHGSWEGEATILDVDTFWVDHLFDKVTIKFYYDAADVDAAYEGTASLDFETSTPYDDMIESSLTFTGSGALAHVTSGV
jgi:hypothetical protein